MEISELSWPYARTLNNVLPGGAYRTVVVEFGGYDDGVINLEFVDLDSFVKFSGVPEKELYNRCNVAGIEIIPSSEGDGFSFISLDDFKRQIEVWAFCRALELTRKKRS